MTFKWMVVWLIGQLGVPVQRLVEVVNDFRTEPAQIQNLLMGEVIVLKENTEARAVTLNPVQVAYTFRLKWC